MKEGLNKEERKLFTVKKGLFTDGVKKELMKDAVSKEGRKFYMKTGLSLGFS